MSNDDTLNDDLLHEAWGVIANVGHKQGGWDAQDREWVEAAMRWRDRWHASPLRKRGELT